MLFLQKIKISGKTGIPVGILGRGLTAAALATLDGGTGRKRNKDEMSEAISILTTLSVRPKNETKEEKGVRKNALKDYRRVISIIAKYFAQDLSLIFH